MASEEDASVSPPIVLCDANLLYPFHLRNLLIQLGVNYVVAPRWTDEIHNEWIRSLVAAGRETRDRLLRTRDLMRRSIGELADRVWHQEGIPIDTSGVRDTFYSRILALSPQNDAQRAIKDRAVAASFDLGQARLLLFTHIGNGISMPFLAVLVFWLAVIFASFSLFAPPNPVVVISLLLFALSAATAIFLILQLADPFTGLMQISSEPLRHALTPLDR